MKKFRNILILCITLMAFQCPAQKKSVVKVRGEAQTEWNQRIETLDQAEKRVSDLATINALEHAFGKLIIQGNNTFVTNVATGKLAETHAVFSSIANTSVKGEVVEVLDKKIRRINYVSQVKGVKEEKTDLHCDIYISAKENNNPAAKFTSATLAQPLKNFITRDFYNGDNFYISFRSPESGYLNIYLDDNKNAFRILPYSGSPQCYEHGMPVNADQEYVFFAGKREASVCDGQNFETDNYQMFTKDDVEFNSVYLLFSKEPLSKPMLAAVSTEGLSDELIGKGYKLPRSLQSPEFYNWLAKVQSAAQVQMERIDISIIKKNK
jgi:hypothetical protein